MASRGGGKRSGGGGDGSGGGGGDDFNKHNESGVSILGCDGNRYVVDESTASYFYEIEALVEKDPEDTPEALEERQILAGNALEEAIGFEMALSMDARCSRIMEKLLKSCTDDDLVRYLGGVTKEPASFFTLCKSLFGSRVAEHALSCVAARVGRNPPEALLEKLAAPLQAVSDAIAGAAVDAAYDPRVSPVARKFLSVLSGRECAPSAKAGNLASKLRGGTSAAGTFADSGDAPPERHQFKEMLSSFSDAALAALEAELWNLTEDSCGSAFLQALLTAHQGDAAALNWIIPGFLGCAPEEGTKEGELLASANEADIKQLCESRSGSHLFEAVLRAAPRNLLGEIFRRFFRGKMRGIAGHPTANFVLQALMGATRDGDHVNTALQELGPDFGSLIRERRAGVVAAILAACARVRAGERDAAKNLARGLTAKMAARKEGRSQLAPALLWLDQHSGAAGGRCSVLGAAMLQTILKFPPDVIPQFVESLASLTPGEALSAACEAGGSRALEAFLGSAAHKPKLKKELIDALGSDWGRLAVSPAGSHVLEACYGSAEQRTRENMVAAMARCEAQIAATRHGPHLLRRLGVTQFQREPEQWRNRVQVAEEVKADFAKTFGGAEDNPDGNGNGDGDGVGNADSDGDGDGDGDGNATKGVKRKKGEAAGGANDVGESPVKSGNKKSKGDDAAQAVGAGEGGGRDGDQATKKGKDKKEKREKKEKKDKKEKKEKSEKPEKPKRAVK